MMAQIFHRSFNTLSRVSIFGGVFILAGISWAWAKLVRSDYVTGAGVVRDQPVPFSHQHHVAGLGIDCRYCHQTVETSAFAGIPSTKVCMNCHAQIWSDSPMLQPVRESFRTGKSLTWNRVHRLPEFVYFDHSIHVNKGVGCSTCHGQVDEMPLTRQVASLYMEWCLECHRQPERFVRPRDQVFNMAWQPSADQLREGLELLKAHKIERRTDCSTCHR
jgi:Cytochrome c7 and related cytochrome c